MNIIIVGEGKEVHFLIKSFISKGHHVTLIINNKEICRRFSKEHEEIEVVYGDATKSTILEDAGAVYANIVIALTQHDPDNLIICQMAKELYGVARTFAIVNDPKNVEIFKKLGLDTIISTVNIISSMIEQKVSIEEITNLISLDEGKLSIFEIKITESSPVIGKMLSEIKIPNSAIIGCIIRKGEAVIPRGDTKIYYDDKLIILSLPTEQRKLFSILSGDK